jgi:hypothetical protein
MSNAPDNAELERWNALTQEEAIALRDATKGAEVSLRSCWWCNGAHEHLKKRPLFICFNCGVMYMGGYPAPVIWKRIDGELLTEADLHTFVQILEGAEDP